MDIRDPAIKAMTDDELRLLSLFAFDDDRHKVDDIRLVMRVQYDSDLTAKAVDQLCRMLEMRGYLVCISDCATVQSRRYELKGSLSPKATLDILGAMKDRGIRQLRTGRAGMLASLINGGAGFVLSSAESSRYFYGWKDPIDDFWFSATRFVEMFRGETLPSFNFPSQTPDSVYRILASVMFCVGLDVTSLLEDWRNKRPDGFKDSEVLGIIEYTALCFWTGRMDLLDAVKKSSKGREATDFLAACISVAKDDLADAYKRTAFMADFVGRKNGFDAGSVISSPASHLFALAVAAFHKPARTKIVKLAAKFQPIRPDFRYELPDEARPYFDWRTKEGACLFEFAGGWEDDFDIELEDCSEWQSPVCRSGIAITALLAVQNRSVTEKEAANALRLAERAVAVKMPTVAAMYLSVFGWAFKGDAAKKAQELAEAVKSANGVWFRAFETDSGLWKYVVEAFDKCLPAVKKGKAAQEPSGAKSGRIVWHLKFRDQNRFTDRKCGTGKDDVMMCSEINPCYRGPRGADDGSDDKDLTIKALLSGKYDKIFTDTDRAVIAGFQKADCLSRYHIAAPYSVLEALCGYDAVTEHFHEGKKGKARHKPIKMVKKDVPLSAKSISDEGLSIAVEQWCMNVIEDYALRSEGEGCYALYSFPKATRAAMEVFLSYGEKGKIEIPKSGMEAVKPLLPRMAAIAPIQGELGSVGGMDMERVNGNPAPLVRIEFAEGVLSLSVRVKPLEDVELLFHPGAGQPERMVVRKGRNAVLVRDLAAEKKSSGKIREAMGEFDSWQEGDGEWRIDSLIHALKALAVLKGLGEEVRLEWRKGKPITIATPKPGSWNLTASDGMDFWFSVGGDFKLDDGKVMSMAELITAYRGRQGEFLPFGDCEYVRLSSALLKRIEALDAAGRLKGKTLSVPSAAIPMLDGTLGGAEDGMLALPPSMEVKASAIREAFAKDVAVPSRLKAQLRPYQRDGYVWLSRLASCGLGSCLADDMGLGKTVQLISLLLERAKDGVSLVVAPASVCGNWRSEIARFAPTLRTIMAWDEKADEMGAVKSAGPGDVVIAGYGLLVSREDQFASLDWNGVVLDEAQAIKNEHSKRAKTVKRLKAKFRVAATGTPVENRLTELWSISDFLNPGLLGSIGDFAKRFTLDGRAAPALKKLVSPLIMRRVKRDVLDDLPEKTEITIPVVLGADERAGYEACRRMALKSLEASGADNRISILAELTRLRRYCCHPSLVVGDGAAQSAKMEALVELLANLRENGHRALVFSQFTDYLAIVRKTVETQGWSHLYLDGQTPASERARLVDAFQRGEGDFFLISLKAGGMGLNLTAANYVILLDPWWNPAVENQATDRVHRIGQKNPVTVYRLIASGTVEERVIELHREKNAIAEDVLDGAAATAFTPDELMKLFQ